MLLAEWAPDFGERAPHPTAGVTAVGCRMPLIAFNINLDTADVEIAKKIAKAIRFFQRRIPIFKRDLQRSKKKGLYR